MPINFCIVVEKKGPVLISETEMAELINVNRLKDEFQKGIDNLKADFVKNLTIRSPFGRHQSTIPFQQSF